MNTWITIVYFILSSSKYCKKVLQSNNSQRYDLIDWLIHTQKHINTTEKKKEFWKIIRKKKPIFPNRLQVLKNNKSPKETFTQTIGVLHNLLHLQMVSRLCWFFNSRSSSFLHLGLFFTIGCFRLFFTIGCLRLFLLLYHHHLFFFFLHL